MADILSGLVKPYILVLPIVDPHLQQMSKNRIIDIFPTHPRKLLQHPDRIHKQGIVIVQLWELVVPPALFSSLRSPTSFARKKKPEASTLVYLRPVLACKTLQKHLAYLIVGWVRCASIIPSIASTSQVELHNRLMIVLMGEDMAGDL